jgi:hypothetical protein
MLQLSATGDRQACPYSPTTGLQAELNPSPTDIINTLGQRPSYIEALACIYAEHGSDTELPQEIFSTGWEGNASVNRH